MPDTQRLIPAASGQSGATPLRREFAVLLPLALPLIAAQVCAMGSSVVDTLLAGHLGANVLAAVALGASLWAVALMAVIGVMMALQPNVAQLDGAGRRHEVMPLFRQGILLGLTIGSLAALVVAAFGPSLTRRVGLSAALQPMVDGYLQACALSLPAIGLAAACRGFSEGLSSTRPSMINGAAGPLLVLPIGYALMYGVGPLPGLRATGSGLTLTIVCWLQAMGYLAWVMGPRRAYRGVDRSAPRWMPDWRVLAGLLRTGLPIAVTLIMEVGMFSTSTLIVGRLGAVPTAAHQIALSAASVAFMVPLGLSMAVTVRVGGMIGAGDQMGARRAGIAGFVGMLASQSCSAVLMALCGGAIVWLYTQDAAVAATATGLLHMAALFQFSDGIQVVANGALRGLKDTRLPMIMAALAYWAVGIPAGAVLAFHFALGVTGMWIGMIAGLTVAAVLLTARFLRIARPHGAVLQPTS